MTTRKASAARQETNRADRTMVPVRAWALVFLAQTVPLAKTVLLAKPWPLVHRKACSTRQVQFIEPKGTSQGTPTSSQRA